MQDKYFESEASNGKTVSCEAYRAETADEVPVIVVRFDNDTCASFETPAEIDDFIDILKAAKGVAFHKFDWAKVPLGDVPDYVLAERLNIPFESPKESAIREAKTYLAANDIEPHTPIKIINDLINALER